MKHFPPSRRKALRVLSGVAAALACLTASGRLLPFLSAQELAEGFQLLVIVIMAGGVFFVLRSHVATPHSVLLHRLIESERTPQAEIRSTRAGRGRPRPPEEGGSGPHVTGKPAPLHPRPGHHLVAANAFPPSDHTYLLPKD